MLTNFPINFFKIILAKIFQFGICQKYFLCAFDKP